MTAARLLPPGVAPLGWTAVSIFRGPPPMLGGLGSTRWRASGFSHCWGLPRPDIAIAGGTLSRLTLSTKLSKLTAGFDSWLPLLPILVLGFALRVFWLDRQSLWY